MATAGGGNSWGQWQQKISSCAKQDMDDVFPAGFHTKQDAGRTPVIAWLSWPSGRTVPYKQKFHICIYLL